VPERFTAVLGERHVVVPLDVRALWGEARPPVRGTVNGVPFRSRLAVYGGETMLGLTNAFRASAGIVEGDEVDVVVEAIGHHAAPLQAAVDALADHGTILAFGVPDDTHYAFPFRAFFRKHATLIAGAATDRAAALENAYAYLREHRALLAPYITTVVGVHDAQTAFETAISPAGGRLKVVLEV